ncbi:MAG TPA: PD-(D/E)XK nuclease family protein, partial [Nitrososphaeraceae archaeon]|nr:PD-(D/E)XK nuclease family protein [Nitrososphaeraceae archaeon]
MEICKPKYSFSSGTEIYHRNRRDSIQRFDRVERTSDGEYEVVDFKTGSVYETKNSIKDNFQMNVYAIATEKLYGKLPRYTSLFYLKKDKIVTNKIEVPQLAKIKKILEEKVHSILEEDFKPTPSFEACRKCDYQMICDSRKMQQTI